MGWGTLVVAGNGSSELGTSPCKQETKGSTASDEIPGHKADLYIRGPDATFSIFPTGTTRIACHCCSPGSMEACFASSPQAKPKPLARNCCVPKAAKRKGKIKRDHRCVFFHLCLERLAHLSNGFGLGNLLLLQGSHALIAAL